MPKKDPRIDAYIERSALFAKPILKHLRKLVHKACPDIEETLKWSFPHFMHKGVVCNLASFKEHCSFGFWKADLIFQKAGAPEAKEEGMGHFGRITSLADLPSDAVLLRYLKEAVRLNDEGIKRPARAKSTERKELVVPEFFLAALKKNKKARETFENFSYSHKKEYVQWITEAKGEDTRQRRLATTLEWLTEGKARHWKYERC